MVTPTVYTPKPLCDPAQLQLVGGGAPTLYTVPAATTTQLTSLILVNDSTTPVNCTLYLVPSGGAADDTDILCKNFTLPADGLPYEIVPINSQGIYMETGATIRGFAATADVATYHISGVELA